MGAVDFPPTSAALDAYGLQDRSRGWEWGPSMQDVTAEIADKNREKQPAVRKSSNGNIALQHCYGQIGISAVAAAVRYQGDSKNPAYAPAAVD